MRLRNWMFVLLVLFVAGCGFFKSTDQKISEAQQSLDKHKYNAAIVILKDVLQSEPDNQKARFYLGRLYYEIGDYEGATKELSRAFKLGWRKDGIADIWVKTLRESKDFDKLKETLAMPEIASLLGGAELAAMQGWLALGKDDNKGAQEKFNSSLASDSSNYNAMLGIAQLQIENNKPEQSKTTLESLLEKYPQDPDAMLLLSTIELQMNNPDQAEKLLNQILQKEPAAFVSRRALTARLNLIRIMLKAQRFDEASKMISDTYKMAPNHPIVAYFQGYDFFRKKNYTRAKELLNQVINNIPSHKPSLLLLGTINYEEKNYEQSNFFLGRYVDSNPKNTAARKMLSASQLQLQQAGEALTTLKPVLDDADIETLKLASAASLASGDVKSGIRYLKSAAKEAPGDIDVRVELARAYMASGDEDEAMNELERTLQQDQGSEKAFAMLINLNLKEGKLNEARILAEQETKKNPNSALHHNTLGRLLAVQKNFKRAESEFKLALEKEPKYWPARLNLAKLHLAQNEPDAADKEFKQISSIDNITVARTYTSFLLNQKRQGDARSYLEKLYESSNNLLYADMLLGLYKLTGDDKKREELIGKLEKTKQGRVLAGFVKGKDLQRGQKSEQAIEAYRDIIKENPKSFMAFTELAQSYLQNKDMDSAQDALEKAVELNKGFVPAVKLLSQVLQSNKQSDKAEKLLKSYISENPNSYIGYELIADFYVRAGNTNQAVMELGKALKLAPKNVELNKKLALVYVRKGDSAKAIGVLKEAIKNAREKDLYSLNVMLANVYREAGNGNQSATIIRELGKENSNDPAKLNDLAWLLYKDDLDTALKFSSAAYSKLPNLAAVNDTHGWILLKKGNKSKGLELLGRAKELLPERPEVEYHYAVALYENGKKDDAEIIFKRLKGLDKNFEGKSDIDKYLK